MTREEFGQCMSYLLNAYPQFRINEQNVQTVWMDRFENLRFDYAKIAIRKYVDEEKYPPVPADIITRYRAVEELNRQHMRDLREVMGLIRQCYADFDDADEKSYMAAIKSQTFEECLDKARKIYRFVVNNPSAEKFSEVVGKWQQNKI